VCYRCSKHKKSCSFKSKASGPGSSLAATGNLGSAQGDSTAEISRVSGWLNSQGKLLGNAERVLQGVNQSQRQFQRKLKGSEVRDNTIASKLELACTKLDDMDTMVKELSARIRAMTVSVREHANQE